MTLDVGIHDITAGEYHEDPCDPPSLSSTIARLLCSQSPLHAWTQHPRLNPDYVREEAEKFDVGTCAHSLMLQGVDVVEIVDAADWRTKAAQEARDLARANGRTPLLAKDAERVTAMLSTVGPQLDKVNANPPLFSDGKPERTLVWEEDGVVCRARCDWLRDDLAAIDDYKTTTNANPEKWVRGPLFDNGYDVQAAFYLRGLEAITGEQAEFRFVVHEKKPPYALTVVALTPAVVELAQAKVEYAIQRWRECVAADEWPGYPTQVCYAQLPGWEQARWLEKEEREFA